MEKSINSYNNVSKLTKEQAAVIGCYTGVACSNFEYIHELAEKLLERPIFTHEFASEKIMEELKEKVKSLFLKICYDSKKD